MKKVVMFLSTGALALTLTGCGMFGSSETTPPPAPPAAPPSTPLSAGTAGYSDFKPNDQIPAPNLTGTDLGAIPSSKATKKAVSSKSKTKATADSSSKKTSSGKSAAVASAGGKTYKVQSGDTLQKISQKFYKTPKKWKKILDANKKVLSDAKKLKAGMTLRIP